MNRDDKKLLFEVTDGVQKASLQATPVNEEKTEVVVVANVPKPVEGGKELEKELEKELSLRIVKVLCDGLGVKCSVEMQ